MEIMYCADGPCLVEVGTRCHGGEGTWIPVAMECVGYSMEKVTLDAYVDPDRWRMLPPQVREPRLPISPLANAPQN